MKKLGFICVALMVALGSLGVGYAKWSHELDITGELGTAAPSANYNLTASNDVKAPDMKDPTGNGTWSWTIGKTLTADSWTGPRQGSNKYKGYTSVVSGTGSQTLSVTISNGSGSGLNTNYWSSVAVTIKNSGSSPVKVVQPVSITPAAGLTSTAGGALGGLITIGPGEEKLGWISFHLVSSTAKTVNVTVNYTLVTP